MNSTAAAVGCRPPFTASQWEELEHQALIFKYLIAGMPVPSELLLPIRRSYETMAARFYHHPALGYCSYYGKKLDPEPGRCRRTDGKKWRCSKDAYPDSKYCERHMHRGRNRSRKHVETPQALSQSQSCCSTATSLAPSSIGSSGSGGGRGGASASIGGGSFSGGNLPTFPLNSITSTHPPISVLSASSSSHLSVDPAPYGNITTKDFRYVHGSKSGLDERIGFYSEAPANARTLGMDYSMDSSWGLMHSQSPCFQLSKNRDTSFPHGSSYPQLQPMQDLGQVTISSLPKHHPHSFFRSDFGPSESPIKTEQPLRPFFDEWPRTRDSWSDLEDERSNRNSFSTTQLSMSIPMSSSDFSTTSSRSPNDD